MALAIHRINFATALHHYEKSPHIFYRTVFYTPMTIVGTEETNL